MGLTKFHRCVILLCVKQRHMIGGLLQRAGVVTGIYRAVLYFFKRKGEQYSQVGSAGASGDRGHGTVGGVQVWKTEERTVSPSGSLRSTAPSSEGAYGVWNSGGGFMNRPYRAYGIRREGQDPPLQRGDLGACRGGHWPSVTGGDDEQGHGGASRRRPLQGGYGLPRPVCALASQ